MFAIAFLFVRGMWTLKIEYSAFLTRLKNENLVAESGVIHEPVKAPDGANSRGRQRGISRSDPLQNAFLVRSGREDSKTAAAVEDRVGEGDTRLRRFTDNRQDPLSILSER